MVGGNIIVKGRNVYRYGPFDPLGRNHHAVSKRPSTMAERLGATFHKNEHLKLLKRKENITQDEEK